MIAKEQYEEANCQKQIAEKVIAAYFSQKGSEFDARWNEFLTGDSPFKDEELLYSATARCNKCKAGLAYLDRMGVGLYGNWDCSDVLTGRVGLKWSQAVIEGHDCLPFAFYEVKSENQPSAYGATTRMTHST